MNNAGARMRGVLEEDESAGTPVRVREGALEGDEGCGVYDTVVQRCGWLCSTVVLQMG